MQGETKMAYKYRYRYITDKIKKEFSSKYRKLRSGCWKWKLYLDSDGYGQIHLKDDDGKHNHCRAHRISWMIHNECDWPETQPVARHMCHNPSCVNPEHIVPGTAKENTQDCIKAGRFNTRSKNVKRIKTKTNRRTKV
jgi:hypothetical protein